MFCLVQGAAAAVVAVSALPPTSAVQHVLRIHAVMYHCESQSEVLEIVDAPWNFPVDTLLSCLSPLLQAVLPPSPPPPKELQLRQEGEEGLVALERAFGEGGDTCQ